MHPKVSVLMPCFNAERFVKEAIESILNQSLREFKFVIVDDGSDDNTLSIVRSYATRDSRIRLIETSHGGIVAALGSGLTFCEGEFVARMDADDVSHPERLERQVAFLVDHPKSAAVGS